MADLPAQVQGLIAYRQADSAEAQALIASELQVRKRSGPRSDQWSPKFFQAIAEVLSEYLHD